MQQRSVKKFLTGFIPVISLIFIFGISCRTMDMGKYSGLSDKVKISKSEKNDSGDSSDGSAIDNMAAKGEVKDYGMTSSAHSKYTGKIVFSKKGIEFKNENESSFTDKFIYKGLDFDGAYFMAYFPRSFHNQAIKDGVKPSTGKSVIIFTFTVNGKKVDKTAEMDFNGEKFKEWTGFSAGPINDRGPESFQNTFCDSVQPAYDRVRK